jgi:hypothetical protein
MNVMARWLEDDAAGVVVAVAPAMANKYCDWGDWVHDD